MSTVDTQPRTYCHVVAMPYPGRGHVSPMMNLCKLVAGKSRHILITFVLTEEWLGLIGSTAKSDNIRFATIPNVIPSEHVRGSDTKGFALAVQSKMVEPFERLLQGLQLSPTLIIADAIVPWAADVASNRNIPLAVMWPMSASVLSMLYHFDLLVKHGHFPVNMRSVNGNDVVDYIPGLAPIRGVDLPTVLRFQENAERMVKAPLQAVLKAQYLLLASMYGLEGEVIDALKANASYSIYSIIPSLKYVEVKDMYSATSSSRSSSSSNSNSDPNYYSKWLNLQPPNSVLFISFGSFLSVSNSQMDEIADGLCKSRTRFLWVARGESEILKLGEIRSDKGLVVPWCDQLSVLCHPSVGGFLSHCGWNSTKEAILAGVPMLTFPIVADQVSNAKMIVEDWGVGWRVRREFDKENLAKRDEIAQLVEKFMDLENRERKQLTERVREMQQVCEREFAEGGLFQNDLDGFIGSILQLIN